ncbi:MAG: 2-oxoglutarate dehydrogenase E1 component [Bacteroidales bacterium]|nr:2-oxoglutarate dehydrogenase E1 component [Bacteroidales bacterium]
MKQAGDKGSLTRQETPEHHTHSSNLHKLTYLGNLDSKNLDQLYAVYLKDPSQLDKSWRLFFEGFELARTHYPDTDLLPEKESIRFRNEFNVINLINGYRERGHLFTKTNPVRTRRTYTPTLDHQNFGLSDSSLQDQFQAGNEIGIGKASLKKIISDLQQTYCQSIGAEFMFIRSPEIVDWLKHRMERVKNTPSFSAEKKKTMLEKLIEAVSFEHFLRKRFPGQKRFSLEGCETLIPALDSVIEQGAALGIEEYIIGMAHRGRLNVLANILKKPYHKIFSEFESKEYAEEALLGDVKYHLGCTLETTTRNKKNIKLSIAPNPSHLEAVTPVVEGIARGKIDQKYAGDDKKVAPILIHGDASIAAQGVVYEVLQMSQLQGYKTGGTIHLVINNQLGFTTNYLDARSSTYCTDVAKTVQSPIFHVNGDDVEAVVYTIELAMEFRQRFGRDVFIDLLCYRKYGHNESDEPRFTQPLLYKTIEKHPDPSSIYIEKLLEQKTITDEEVSDLQQTFYQKLEKELELARQIEKGDIDPFLQSTWGDIKKAKLDDLFTTPDTGVEPEALKQIGKSITRLPEDKDFFRKTLRMMQDRNNMILKKEEVDWALGESLAYATLLAEGISVRISGQDVERGTFSHRHAVLKIEDSEEEYVPLNHISPRQASFEIYNSPLSEYGVLGFDYGYAMVSPYKLIIWEAQFGDFNNGAQVIIDQFIASAEEKWKVLNGLVMYLPHGYEGQGPEHSSGRMERFLSLCAENNIQVANCTTPANLFHLLRLQMKRSFRKPLVIFTPKSLLRHPDCVSPLADLSGGRFLRVIDDEGARPEETERVIFCSGKIYYDLKEEKKRKGFKGTAIVRLEQLYPLPEKELEAVKEKYRNAQRWLWVQEEPQNMGAWPFIKLNLKGFNLSVIARPPSGSPASGSSKFHQLQQQKIVEKAFEECDCENVCRECRQLCISHMI